MALKNQYVLAEAKADWSGQKCGEKEHQILRYMGLGMGPGSICIQQLLLGRAA